MMKNLITLLLAINLLSCEKETIPSSNLEGSWEMTEFIAMVPQSPVLNTDDVAWKFDQNGLLTIQNTIHANYPYMEQSNVHPYQIQNNILSVLGNSYTYSLSGNPPVLVIQDSAVVTGAPYRTFKKK